MQNPAITGGVLFILESKKICETCIVIKNYPNTDHCPGVNFAT